jgi:hypothetical protein
MRAMSSRRVASSNASRVSILCRRNSFAVMQHALQGNGWRAELIQTGVGKKCGFSEVASSRENLFDLYERREVLPESSHPRCSPLSYNTY